MTSYRKLFAWGLAFVPATLVLRPSLVEALVLCLLQIPLALVLWGSDQGGAH
jgi:hypothetical protein